MKISERIRLKRKEFGLTQSQLADLCQWKNGFARISNYEKNLRQPNYYDILLLAKHLSVTPEWLFFGVENANDQLDKKLIPFFNLAQAYNWVTGMIREMPEKEVKLIYADDGKLSLNKVFFTQIEGDSMVSPNNIAESCVQGDLALVDPLMEPQVGHIVLMYYKGETRLRKIMLDGTQKIFKPLNEQYPIIKFSPRIQILGVLVMTQRHRIHQPQ